MYVTFTTLYFSIAVLIFTFTLLKLSDRFHPYFQNSPSQFKLYYKITIIIMIILIIIIGLIYKYCYLKEINMNPAKNEVYRLEQANYNIYIQDNGSADIEHLLKLHRNKNSPIKESKNFISYEFQEIGNISDIQVFVNDKKMYKDVSKMNGTYTTYSKNNKNNIDIYLPYFNEEINIKLKYFVENALVRDGDNNLTYYNTFISYRSGLSYNTQFKGSINFFMAKNYMYKFAADSKDLYLETKKDTKNIAQIYFENKLPYAKNPINSNGEDAVKRYDKFDDRGDYMKDFSITTRIDIKGIEKLNFKEISYLKEGAYSIDKLNILNNENNKKYSDILFVYGFFTSSFTRGNWFFLIISSPIIYCYYKKKLKEYWQYLSNRS